MDTVGIGLALMAMDKKQSDAILKSAIDEYFEMLYLIASDIYDSCIQEYYSWIPDFYDRHENVTGWNLYQSNEVSYENFELSVYINSERLEPYNSGGNPDRDYILSNVMKGIRGGKNMRIDRGWPKKWKTSYPNKYSKLGGIWSSSETTIGAILDDFIDNVMSDTEQFFYEFLAKRL